MKTNRLITTTLAGLAAASVFAVATPATHAYAAAPTAPTAGPVQLAATGLPVTGTLANGTAFTGQISNLTTSVVNGVLTMTGNISGTGIPGTTTFAAPVNNVTATGCQVLNLDLGPLNLDLLGLVVNLAPVHLNITAQPGSGQLLGNLLCAVTHLLDNTGAGGGALSGLSTLLNRLLAGLGL